LQPARAHFRNLQNLSIVTYFIRYSECELVHRPK
jgi:hypothetical protein